jgi:predicted transcriptional regulator
MSDSFESMSYKEAREELMGTVRYYLNEILEIANYVNRLIKQANQIQDIDKQLLLDEKWLGELEQMCEDVDKILDAYDKFKEHISSIIE